MINESPYKNINCDGKTKSMTINIKEPIENPNPILINIKNKGNLGGKLKLKILYPIKTYLKNPKSKEINIKLDHSQKIFVCAYRINTSKNNFSTKMPFLEYLLFKFPANHEEFSNVMTFPFINRTTGTPPSYLADELFFKLFKFKSESIGVIEYNNNLYFFYDINKYLEDSILSITYRQSGNQLFWCLIDEICNHNKYINFPIHSSTYKLFYNNPILLDIKNNSFKKYPIPKVAYVGSYAPILPAIANSMNTLQEESSYHNQFGSYIYSIRNAGWTSVFKRELMQGKKIADKNGKYTEGGIVRFALFLQNPFIITNNPGNDVETFIKNDNIWKKSHDSLILGILKDKKGYFSSNPSYKIKYYNQKTPLTIHLLDMKTLDKWNPNSKHYKIL